MKQFAITMVSVAVLGLGAGQAKAACDFDIATAKGVKGSMVRAYAACPGTENPTSNTETEGGTEACAPVTPAEIDGVGTLYSFGPKGACTTQSKAKLINDCSELEDAGGTPLGLQSGPCHVTYVKGKCKGILGTDGLTLIGPTDTGWSYATLSRTTLADDTNGDMTVIDFPVTFLFSEPKNGGMKLSSSSAEALVPLVGANNADLPDCTSIEIVDTTIKDPAGLPFATLGGATLP